MWLKASGRKLLAGAMAAGVDALVSVVAMGLLAFTEAGSRAIAPLDVSAGELLQLLAIVPEAFVLIALLAVARGTGSIALWRSSIGFFGCFWLVQVVVLAEGPTWWEITVSLVALIGLVSMLAAVFSRPWLMAEPVPDPPVAAEDSPAQAEGHPPAPPPPPPPPPVIPYRAEQQKTDWSWIWIALVIIVGRRALRAMGLTFEDVVELMILLLILGVIGFLIWLAIAKMTLAHRLGTWAIISGVADLALVALSACSGSCSAPGWTGRSRNWMMSSCGSRWCCGNRCSSPGSWCSADCSGPSGAARRERQLDFKSDLGPVPGRIGVMRYLRNLNGARLVLWCYFIWYLVVLVRYFEPDPRVWLTALGLSVIIGLALLLNTTSSGRERVRLEGWPTFRLFLTPFCVSSFAALVKGEGFVLIFSPDWREMGAAAGLCVLFLGVVMVAKQTGRGEMPRGGLVGNDQ